jgi:hypothetical protein
MGLDERAEMIRYLLSIGFSIHPETHENILASK